jgi:CheY-like chemotaxis protein
MPKLLSPLCVLVVDDNAINREMVATLLDHWGIETVLAADGSEAVHLVAFTGTEFDLVLMDVQMPVMNGITAISKIRQFERDRADPEPRRLPVVAYTTEKLHEAQLRQFGFDAMLPKPFAPNSLISCLAHWCPNKFQPN